MGMRTVVHSGGEVRLSERESKIGTALSIRLFARLDDGQQIALPDFDLEVREINGFDAQTLWGLLSFREPGREFAAGSWQALADALAGRGIAVSAEELAQLPFEFGTADDVRDLIASA